MTDTDPQKGARLLRQLRDARGWSWTDVARSLRDTACRLGITSLTHRQVASIQRTIARWESPSDRTSPGDRYQLLLAHLYARTPSGNLALGAGSDFATLLDAFRYFGTSTPRIQQIVDMVVQNEGVGGSRRLGRVTGDHSGVDAALRYGSQLEPEVLGRLHESVTALNRQIGSTPFVRLQLQLTPVVDLCRRLLARGRDSPSDGLVLLASSAHALAARLAFETRDHETAMALYADATALAGRLSDRSHRAAARTSHSMVVLHATNDVEVAGKIARAATTDAHQGSSYAIRSRAHAVHAEICARAGRATASASALERAWRTLGQATVGDPHGGFDADRLNGFEGLCALYAGDADRAHDRLERSLATLRTSRDAVQRGIVSTDLALARLRLGHPAACVDLLHEAVDIAAATGGRVAAQRIRLVRRDLHPWRSEDFLTDLDDHIHDMLLGR